MPVIELSDRRIKGRRHYRLMCPLCGGRQPDDGLLLDCRESHAPAFLRTEYASRKLTPVDNAAGIYRYQAWLPVARSLPTGGAPVVYRSVGLGSRLGLDNLWIAFNGYWPEKGALLETATFKELEALTVVGRLPEQPGRLVLASAGNTAAAFAAVCSRYQIPALILIPRNGLRRMRLREPAHPCVQLVVAEGADYADCITLAQRVSEFPGFNAEGGAKNVGRRDGLGTVLLTAFEALGRLPDYYFQAVGSGAGAIAVHEAARRIMAADATQPALPRLMLGQNTSFAPLYDAWRSGGRTPPTKLGDHARQIREAFADELTNRCPPFAVHGGAYDSLAESGGDVLVADAASAQAAMQSFHQLEGVDIEPAAGVAVACLEQAVNAGRIPRDALVLLNITGGGRARLAQEHSLTQVKPRLFLTVEELRSAAAPERLAALASGGLAADAGRTFDWNDRAS
jgi:cysteate synthase